MSISPNSSFDENENLSFITSNKGHPLLVMNEQLYKCNKKTARKNIEFVLLVDAQMVVYMDENDVYLYGGKCGHHHQSNLLTDLSLVVGAKKKHIETQFTAEE
ncbi:unnamed protein product [Rotaria socialis]|uniref:Uncharacterized protein n=1 Tax=Rotaria socialis TaxID=392032 RepID=A0A821JRR4_9BILA|nr:unnamed protein product [Rotaria socialis]CAF3509820.1 unnamed protein product [Rotaria socialis]CAF3553114.1 unnamed protein product [Rotaria socialis]CAF4357215.1 unnamed protein product [Rotaria socialis]CAF4629049.1 unnamed protein product [Rotaria socialis]